ncbi:MAG TPA: ABC transporter permease [Thermoanaerobaculia bacterium]|nr:ABC transporter permease [Thermoanaerobaculia bacterium]
MESLLRDLRHAVRSAVRVPGFTALAALTLALGIGAATLVFALADAVLLRPFPFHEPERLVTLWGESPGAGHPRVEVSPLDAGHWRAGKVFPQIALLAASDGNAALTLPDGVVPVRYRLVSAGFFEVLGARPALGRTFKPGDDRPSAWDRPLVVISDRVWRQHLGSDPDIAGRTLRIDSETATVTGVMPPEFRFPYTADLWYLYPESALPRERSGVRIFQGIARLEPGMTLHQARDRMSDLSDSLQRKGLKQFRDFRATVRPLVDDVLGDTRPALRLLLGAVELLLLAACADAAGLMLTRADERRKEIAVRTALGAGQPLLLRQFLLESFLLAAPAAALGLLLARGGLSLLLALGPRDIPRLDEAAVDGRAVLFALIVTLAVTVLLGLLPALQIPRSDLSAALKEGGHAPAGRRASRLRRLLVVSEVALALVLLVGAGLTARSFARLRSTDLGFSPEGLFTFRIALDSARHPTPAEQAAWFREAVERLRNVPGAERVAAVLLRPLAASIGWEYQFLVEGQTEKEQISNPISNHEGVSPGYFATMGIPLLEGRDFTWDDGPAAPPVAIVSRSMAERFWPGESALGRRLRWLADEKDPWLTVVGVVGDAHYLDLSTLRYDIYVPFQQDPHWSMDLVLRTRADDPMDLEPAVRSALEKMAPGQPLLDVTTLTRSFSESVARPRLRAAVLVAFAGIALLFAAVGLYGLISWSVSQRRHEIGVRLALGADRGHVFRLVLRQGLVLILAGLAAGIAIAVGVLSTGLLDGLLHGIRPLDVATFTTVPLLLLAAGLAASLSPALHATEVEPRSALQGD